MHDDRLYSLLHLLCLERVGNSPGDCGVACGVPDASRCLERGHLLSVTCTFKKIANCRVVTCTHKSPAEKSAFDYIHIESALYQC